MLRLVMVIFFMSLSGVVAADVQPQIAVRGEARLAVKPDMARINIGVAAQSQSAAEALAQMSTDLTAVLEGLRTAGIAPADLQTSALSLSERYAPQEDYNDPRIVIGYVASSAVLATVRDLPELGALLDKVASNGANRINGLSFDVSNRAALQEQAQTDAIADAMDKTARFAKAGGVSAGAIVSISEAGARSDPFEGEVAEFAAQSRSVPIAAGNITIYATVNMVTQIAE